MKINHIYEGDCLEVLRGFPDGVVDMCITSPPYYGLRDYGVEGQLGLEPTLDLYLEHLVDIFNEVGRVLVPEGTLWVNLGDSYSGNNSRASNGGRAGFGTKREGVFLKGEGNIPQKSLMLVPERFAIKMVDVGWILRNVIVWHKPSCLPESMKDRFTKDFEYLYFFSKQGKYYFKQQLEPMSQSGIERMKRGRSGEHKNINGAPGQTPHTCNKPIENDPSREVPLFRNKRSVWKIPPASYKKAHFATYPQRLIMSPIDAGCPEGGVVLDPFMGAGTTAKEAIQQRKNYVGIELNSEYAEMARERVKAVQQDLF